MSDTVFHYTNLNAFQSIIENKELWFSRIDCLNDTTEYNFYKFIFNVAKTQFMEKHNLKNNKFFNSTYLDDFYLKIRDEFYNSTYTFSLTFNKDSIPMWNYYSNKSGLAIGFNYNLLSKELRQNLSPYFAVTIFKTEYNFEKQIEEIISKFEDLLKLNEADPEFNNILSQLWTESHKYKHLSFEYENELRITICKLNPETDNIKYDTAYFMTTSTDIKQIKKAEITNWNDIITDIIISPYNPSNTIKDNIYDFLTFHNINIDPDKIYKSYCPIRAL